MAETLLLCHEIGIKLNVSTGKRHAAGAAGSVSHGRTGHVCADRCGQALPGLVFLGSGLELRRGQSAPRTALWTTGSSVSAAEEMFPGRQNQKMLSSLTHLDRCLAKPLLSRDQGPKVLPLSPAGRSEQVWGMEMLLQQEKKKDKLKKTSRALPEISRGHPTTGCLGRGEKWTARETK